jgi:hypothetical protein
MDELLGRHARPDDKCQDLFSLKAAKSRLSVPIFFASEDFRSIVAAMHQPIKFGCLTTFLVWLKKINKAYTKSKCKKTTFAL